MIAVLRARTERLACGFDARANYFAWAAFARGYKPEGDGPVPPYLERRAFPVLRARVDRVRVLHANMVDHLQGQPDASLDCYVLLDAQGLDGRRHAGGALGGDHPDGAARGPGDLPHRRRGEPAARPPSPDALLSRWRYDRARCRALTARDRSAIYGGFHLYVLAP